MAKRRELLTSGLLLGAASTVLGQGLVFEGATTDDHEFTVCALSTKYPKPFLVSWLIETLVAAKAVVGKAPVAIGFSANGFVDYLQVTEIREVKPDVLCVKSWERAKLYSPGVSVDILKLESIKDGELRIFF
jgi:hypothetical protein